VSGIALFWQLAFRLSSAVDQHLTQERMTAKRLTESEKNRRKLLSQPLALILQVLLHVHSSREEIRKQDDTIGSSVEATPSRLLDGGPRQFQESDLDHPTEPRAQLLRDMMQVRVGLGLPAPVGNQHKSGCHAIHGSRIALCRKISLVPS